MRVPARSSSPTRCRTRRAATTRGRRPECGASRGFENRWACCACAGPSLLELTLRTDLHHVPDEPELLHPLDQEAARIERQLPPAQPVRSGGGERVVVVVPRLAER